jgi:ubiquinone/menaquinone biosynthesis C-methylase UbiE
MTDQKTEEEKFYNLKYSPIIDNNSITYNIENLIYSNNRITYDYFFNLISMNVLNKNVLECGCGIEGYSQKLAGKSNHYIAIDLSEKAIKYQKDKTKQLGINAEYYIMDIENLNFNDRSFDVIFGKSILHHTDLKKTFSELSRVLKSNGQAFFLEPIKYNPIVFAFRKLTPAIRTKNEHPLTIKDIGLAKTYFHKVEIEYFNFLSYITLLPYLSGKCNANLFNHLDKKFLNIIPFPILFATIMICKFSN